jgi:predicted acyl esterase
MIEEGQLCKVAPDLAVLLTVGAEPTPVLEEGEIRRETVRVAMRDGVLLATDLYLPPQRPAPSVILRTPYGRASDVLVTVLYAFARQGYAVVSQDCRGTGESEPAIWDYYVWESEDGYDCVEWLRKQPWCGDFLGACGGSYVGQTQWPMALHPAMTTIVPEVSGLGIAANTVHLYLFLNVYARTIGKGPGKESGSLADMERSMHPETMAGGFFNDPLYFPIPHSLHERYPQLQELRPTDIQHALWKIYSGLSCHDRTEFIKEALNVTSINIAAIEALPRILGQSVSHDALSLPHANPAELCESLYATPLMITGWYDWALNDALATWALLRKEAREAVRSRTRLIIAPSAHHSPGYRENSQGHPELERAHRLENQVCLLLKWFAAVRDSALAAWPPVIYYLMGANEWHTASDWPPRRARDRVLYLRPNELSSEPPDEACEPDRYIYNPEDPPPTLGGSILSTLYTAGSVDVRAVQARCDVLTYTTAPLEHPLDVVGPLRLLLYASSSAVDTDFSARLSDVFPDGRSIQLQSGILRLRHRGAEPALLEPGRIYRLEVDLWATANRFERGHQLRLDICSADFPRFDRNANLGGRPGQPVRAEQTIYHDAAHPSQLILSVLN